MTFRLWVLHHRFEVVEAVIAICEDPSFGLFLPSLIEHCFQDGYQLLVRHEDRLVSFKGVVVAFCVVFEVDT